MNNTITEKTEARIKEVATIKNAIEWYKSYEKYTLCADLLEVSVDNDYEIETLEKSFRKIINRIRKEENNMSENNFRITLAGCAYAYEIHFGVKPPYEMPYIKMAEAVRDDLKMNFYPIEAHKRFNDLCNGKA